MPIYVYECTACSAQQEVLQAVRAEPLQRCSCGGSLRKVLQPATPIFVGRGFHVNDYPRSRR